MSSSSDTPIKLGVYSSHWSSLGVFDISNVPLRVITPPRPRPLLNVPDDNIVALLREIFGQELEETALKIANEHVKGAKNIEAILGSRAFLYSSWDSQPTILIVLKEWTPESSPGSWQVVVEKVKQFVDQRVSSTPAAKNIQIAVEMVSADLERRKYLTLLDDDDKTYPRVREAWPRIQDHILRILESFSATAGYMTVISLFRLGYDKYGNNPTTVYVAVSYESPEIGWSPVVASMQMYLDTFDLDLHVHLEHNEMSQHISTATAPGDAAHAPFPLVFQNLHVGTVEERRDFHFKIGRYERRVHAGADIGAATYLTTCTCTSTCRQGHGDNRVLSPGNGTLGCWLDVKTRRDDTWKTVALTCYHVVRPAIRGFRIGCRTHIKADGSSVNISTMANPLEGSDLWTADRKGLTPLDVDVSNRESIELEHPTRGKHNFQVRSLRQIIEKLQGQGVNRIAKEQLLRETVMFFDQGKHILGRVWLASGYLRRTPSGGGRLDWALVFPTARDRIGENKLPSEEDWTAKYPIVDIPWPKSQHLLPRATCRGEQSMHDRLRNGDRAFKMGAATTCSIGSFNGLQCLVGALKEEKYIQPTSDRTAESREYTFLGVGVGLGPAVFGNRGDSGAVVWDQDGRILGLMVAGMVPQNCKTGFSLVTPIEDVFEDIVLASKGEIVDIRLHVLSE